MTTAESLEIPAAGIALTADVTVPESAQGVVLFAHGSGSGRHSTRNRYVAGELHAAGLAREWFVRHLRGAPRRHSTSQNPGTTADR
jgi:predicted alpha/beta-hydrolase family hydrolase